MLPCWAHQKPNIEFFGFKFGFWWAQQGSIYVFVALIFIYAAAMRRIDRKHGVSDDGDAGDGDQPGAD